MLSVDDLGQHSTFNFGGRETQLFAFGLTFGVHTRVLSSLIAYEEVAPMASVVVRGLEEFVKKQLATQAKEHGRSMEAEVRDILTKAARRPHIGLALMQAARDAGGVDDLPVPERTDIARAVDFG